jgi:hypothetical protein
MAQITNGELQIIGDKLARFAAESVGDPEFNADFSAGMELASNNVLSGAGGIATYILTLNDQEDVVADLLPAARDLDEVHPTPGDGFLLTIKGVNSMIAALNTHFKRYGYAGLDAYLTTQNSATPTLRFHHHFRKYLKTISGLNSFIPNDLDIASFSETGAATGTYAHLAAISKTENAGAKLVAKNVGALASSAVISVTAKKWDGTTEVLTATLATHDDAHETNLSNTGQLYIDVTGISMASGGTSADVFKIVAKTDRDISAA